MRRFGYLGGLLSLSLLVAGCGGAQAQFDAARARYLLVEEPAEPVGILELRESAVTGDVVVVGRVGGVSQPWSKGQAAFIISDPTAGGDDGHVCTDEGCPFCAKKKQAETDAIAVVQFVDEQGRILPLDARELFQLKSDQTIVVQGRATVDALGSLILSANGLYIRR
jgi:hypothetical protein